MHRLLRGRMFSDVFLIKDEPLNLFKQDGGEGNVKGRETNYFVVFVGIFGLETKESVI